jgi:RimJ/RimL family protein N-acetyltransferase
MTQSFDLRPAGMDDIDLLARVDDRLAVDPSYRRHICDLLSAGLSWLAVEQGEPLGFVVVTRHFFGFPFVDLLFVGEGRRRGGVGAALMAQCERAHDADRIFTSTNESNAPMRALLAKAGWRPAGVIHYLDPGDPELMFVRLRARA